MAAGLEQLPIDGDEGSILFPPFRLDLLQGQLWRGECLVPLKPKAFSILRALLEQPGQLLTQRDLLARLWGGMQLSDGVLKTQIAELRQALGDSARRPRFIETAHRRGYRFIAPVEWRPSNGLARRPGAPDAAAQPPPLPAHFVGRERELRALLGSWSKAKTGDRQMVFVTGEAGAGKTGLVNAFLRQLKRAEAEPSIVAWGQCIGQYGAGEPYLPIIEALRRCCADPGSEQVADCLRRNAPSWLAVLPSLQASAPEVVPTIPPGRMLREIVETLEVLAGYRPVALLIEDLHWADYSTLDLLAYLARRSDRAPLLVLGTYRPAEVPAAGVANLAALLQAGRAGCELPVPLFNQESVADYLALRFAGHRLPSALAALIHERTAGNALYMVGLVDGWLQRGLLRDGPEGCTLVSDLPELARCIPDGFARMIESVLERLTPSERNVLEAASVAGNEFSTATVAAALATDPMQVEELCVRWARQSQFFRSKGAAAWLDGTVAERCEFRHVLYQQIIYQQLGAGRLAQWHLRIAERLERGYGTDAESSSPELALHFQRGHDHLRAIRYLRCAGERALRSSAYYEAIDPLTRALELLSALPESPARHAQELDLLLLLASPLRLTRGYAAPELERLYTRAAQLCEGGASTPHTLLVLVGLGSFQIIRADYSAALPLGERLLQLAEHAHDDAALAEAHLVVGAACHFLGEHQRAVQHLHDAVRVHEMHRADPCWNMTSLDRGFAASGMLAHSYWMLGNQQRAHTVVDGAVQQAAQLDSPVAQAYALNFALNIRLISGELDEVWQLAERLHVLSLGHGLQMFTASALLHGAAAKIARGDAAAGLRDFERGWELYTATGTSVYSSFWVGVHARGHALLGEPGRALLLLDEALGADRPRRELIWEAELWRIRGELLLQADELCDARSPAAGTGGDSLSAEGSLRRALAVAQQQSALPLVLRSALSLAQHWRESGRTDAARELLAEACAVEPGAAGEDAQAARAYLHELGGS